MHIYLHIPFCKQACYYCDFHFSTSLSQKEAVVEAICQEIRLQKSYLKKTHISTIYFGGGTPSILDETSLGVIFSTLHQTFTILPDAEITLEANPDDISVAKLAIFKKFGINRLSIGIQSFHEPHLKQMNRAHNAKEAETCVKLAQDAGIDNITIDLIYAIPAPDHQILYSDLAKVEALNLQHVSAYCLTIEPQTVFGKWTKQGKMPNIDDDFSAQQFSILVENLQRMGYEQYEISNFARNQHYSKHNTSYWKQEEYLGIGPSAHSFNGVSRQYNIANNTKYVQQISAGIIPATLEILTKEDQINEYLLTGLRTIWGCKIEYLDSILGSSFLDLQKSYLQPILRAGHLEIIEHTLKLTEAGKLFADRIASDLFVEE
ncbi:radical SAM family heme chaperone HemW [Flectobacillus roseus]|uniref:Heme chaperone HemW n=1 Tax=Flectobacillus roseus TaxID=502259 RepID=A0ABT6Y625_9BACT|nr:radical SAM family heme chaperone HemW [Flectobacillus roseus]MDI9859015.1 radical SAM family heme chaperone HemW [Flectobacillus roseus]